MDALETFASLKESQWSADDVKGIFKSDSINPKLPVVVSKPNDLIGVGISARIIPTLKFGMLSSMNYTNNDKIQERLSGMNVNGAPSRNKKSGGTMTQTTPYGKKTGEIKQLEPQDLTDEIFEDLLNNELENIPAGIIQGIRNKIVTGEKLNPNEELIVDSI
jgi:hypothetical protein